MRFAVRSVSVEPNVRGQEMRRIRLYALPSEPFISEEPLPEGVPAVDEADGSISVLVNASFARRFQAGDEFDVSFRERAD